MITVIFTCFNRREKTLQCIKSLSGGNKDIAFQYVIVDDNSTDGTYEALEDLKRSGMTIDVLRGTGNLFWAGGMRKGIAYAKEKGCFLTGTEDIHIENINVVGEN